MLDGGSCTQVKAFLNADLASVCTNFLTFVKMAGNMRTLYHCRITKRPVELVGKG